MAIECTADCEWYQYASIFGYVVLGLSLLSLPLDIFHIWGSAIVSETNELSYSSSEKVQNFSFIPFVFNSILTVIIQASILVNLLVKSVVYYDELKPFKFSVLLNHLYYHLMVPTAFIVPNYLLLIPQSSYTLYLIK